MQGYIIRLQPVKDEDLIVTILTQTSVVTSYRFYGARHSTINLGYKIDAELIPNSKSTIPQLRNILHLAHSWQHIREKMFFWQNFISLFYEHLKGIEDIDEFYFLLLERVAKKMQRQNPKRLAVEAYAELLEYEGRMHSESTCFLCENEIQGDTAVARGFLPAHPKCLQTKGINADHFHQFLQDKSTLLLEDDEVELLYKSMIEGF